MAGYKISKNYWIDYDIFVSKKIYICIQVVGDIIFEKVPNFQLLDMNERPNSHKS